MEGCGLSELAVQAWRAVLAHHPDDPGALEALARLHDLRGDERRAAECRRRLAAIGVAAPMVSEAPPDAWPSGPDADLVRFVHLFGGRAGVHARMWTRDGEVGYAPIHAPLDPGIAEAHLRGDVTVGSYLVRHGDLCAQLVFDLDARREAVERVVGHEAEVRDLAARASSEGLRIAAALEAAGVPALHFDSGFKGRHHWVFLEPPAPAHAVRALGLAWAAALAPSDPDLTLEVFPRQDHVPAGGLGNLVKLPLGIHLRTGRRCVLLDGAGEPVEDPWPTLRGVRGVPLASLPRPTGPSRPMIDPAPVDPQLPAVAAPLVVPFTEGDLDARPRLAAVLSGCSVLREVVRRALADRRLSHDERVALEHTIGHWPEGVEAVNWLLDRVGSQEPRMGKPHQGSPTSCKGLRRRLAELADGLECRCPTDVAETYPSPNLLARHLPAQPPAPPPDLDELLDRLGRLEERARLVDAELRALRTQAAAGLAHAPGGRHRTESGTWWVEDVEGLPIVRHEPAGRS